MPQVRGDERFPESLVALGMDDRGILFFAGGVVAGLIAVFAITHTSRMSFSFLYSGPFRSSPRSLRTTRRAMLASVLAVRRLCVEVLFLRSSRASRRRDSVFQRDVGIFRAMVQLDFSRARYGHGIAALWPAAVLGAVPMRGDAAAVPAETL
ncbi:MAG: hypothetical protein ACLUW6_05485 [Coriobacteriaceae bacterium]